MICGFDGKEFVGLTRSKLSEERITTVQWGFDFPRVGRRNARVSDERGTVASRASELGCVNLREDLWMVMWTFLRTGEVTDIEWSVNTASSASIVTGIGDGIEEPPVDGRRRFVV